MNTVCCDSISTGLTPHIGMSFTFRAPVSSPCCVRTWERHGGSVRLAHAFNVAVLKVQKSHSGNCLESWGSRSLCLALSEGPLNPSALSCFLCHSIFLSLVCFLAYFARAFSSSITISVLAASSVTALANTTVGSSSLNYISAEAFHSFNSSFLVSDLSCIHGKARTLNSWGLRNKRGLRSDGRGPLCTAGLNTF